MKYLLPVLLLLAACTTTAPVQPTEPEQPAPVQDVKPVEPVVPTPTKPALTVAEIVAKHPGCAKYSWKPNRGVAPIGYVKGMAQSYAVSYCRLAKVGDNPATDMAKSYGPETKDVLALYGIKAGSEHDNLRNIYTFLIGLGMKESSGFYREGRDKSANNVRAETAESGLFQFSYNMHKASPWLDVLYKEYQANPERCMESTFKEGARKTFNTNYSIDLNDKNQAYQQAGLAFQKFTRKCPAFAAEYTAVGLRVLVAHWGPAKRKEAEFRTQCGDMLREVEQNTVCTM